MLLMTRTNENEMHKVLFSPGCSSLPTSHCSGIFLFLFGCAWSTSVHWDSVEGLPSSATTSHFSGIFLFLFGCTWSTSVHWDSVEGLPLTSASVHWDSVEGLPMREHRRQQIRQPKVTTDLKCLSRLRST